VFGFYTADTWKESNSFYGSSECLLFRSAHVDTAFVLVVGIIAGMEI
jgi:hypothetical protein